MDCEISLNIYGQVRAKLSFVIRRTWFLKICRIMSSNFLFLKIMCNAWLADTFHEVKRRRDRRKEVGLHE